MRRTARTAADGVGARGWLEMGGEEAAGDERPWLRGRLRTANGCGELRGWLRTAWVQGGSGEEAAGDGRAWLRGRLRTANGWGELRGRLRTAWVPGSGWKWVRRRSRWRSASLAARTAADGKWPRRIARTAADGVRATEWLEMGGEKKPLEISELGCADGCGREMGAENCADCCGRRGCNGVAGNGWGEEAAGDQRAWLRGGCGRQMGGENCADACGRRGCHGVAGNGWGEEAAGDQRAWLRGRLRTGNGCGELRGRLRARELLEMGGEKKPLVMSELGCAAAADGKWVWRIARTAADGVGATEWVGRRSRWSMVMSELGCADGCGRQMGAENCADGCGRRGCNGVAGNGWREEAAGDERAWLRGRLRTANGWGELRGRLRTAWVQGKSGNGRGSRW